jgi:beta-glucanase (GH16 family)
VPAAAPPPSDCRAEEAAYVRRAAAERWALMETFAGATIPEGWEAGVYPWPENGCVMNDSTIAVRDGLLALTVRARGAEESGAPASNGDDDGKICVGGELHSTRFFARAHVAACLRTEATPGTVAAFFAISKYQQPVWNQQEIDFEWLGKDLGLAQLNVHNHTRPPDTDLTGAPSFYPLGFAADAGFHRYDLEWDGARTRFWVDGTIAEVRTNDNPTLPLDVVFNHYAVTPSLPWAAKWAGPLRDTSLPARTFVDWVAVREIRSEPPSPAASARGRRGRGRAPRLSACRDRAACRSAR